MQVSSAAAYSSASAWDSPSRRQHENTPSAYSSPASSLPSSPFKPDTPTRPLLAAGQGSPLSLNRSQQSRVSQRQIAGVRLAQSSSRVQQSAMAGTGDRWASASNHDYHDIPATSPQNHQMDRNYHVDQGHIAPPAYQGGYDSHGDHGYQSYHQGHEYQMDDRFGSTSHEEAGAHYSHSYTSGDATPHEHDGIYNAGPFADPSPSPARLSRADLYSIDPSSIADDDDHGFDTGNDQKRGKRSKKALAAAGAYSSIGGDGSPGVGGQGEKSAWRKADELARKRRKRKLCIILSIIAVLLIAGAVFGGIAGTIGFGAITGKKSSSSSSSTSSVLTKDSAAIKALMNNKNLHKVFPVMDYTPYNTQYPDCLANPPSQDNVTMDMAVLSQLTPAIRVYGTDCSQTEMALKAIDRLGLNDTMKIWLGVWIDGNTTTNDRQISQMYDILGKYPQDHFKGLIIGNEVLFRKEYTEAELITLLQTTRTNLTSDGITLSVSTSDLGSSWTTTLAAASDHVMGNIHPFFAGVTAAAAAGWTYTFWQNNDVSVAPEPTNAAKGAVPRNIISETGWPSGGGNDCGVGGTCTGTTDGSVAGISEMNSFMDGWICGANTNNTLYFWFEAFDEPWKAVYNNGTEQWEDKWGLMGIDRKLKSGITIPDCGGTTVA